MTIKSIDSDRQPSIQRNVPSWMVSPQRVWLRRAIFQVHLWVGLVVTAYAIIIGLSGSALVFREEIERATRPSLYHLAPSTLQVSLATTIRRIETDRPGWRAFDLSDIDRPDHALTLLMTGRDGSPTLNFRIVSFNRHTGDVLLDRMRYDGFLGRTINLHWYLLTGNTGLHISGWGALGLLTLCLTGVVIWWPGVHRWTSSLVFHHRSSWQRVNWDFHTIIGFWTSALLLVVTFTGISFAFPSAVTTLMILATGHTPRSAGNIEASPTLVAPSTAPILTIDRVVAIARSVLPPNAQPSEMQFPDKPNSPYKVIGYYIGTTPYSQPVGISLDPHTGSVLAYSDTRVQPLGLRLIQSFFAIHFGWFAGDGSLGLAVKVIWVFIGLSPALLGITGVLMYWNRKLRPLWKQITSRTTTIA